MAAIPATFAAMSAAQVATVATTALTVASTIQQTMQAQANAEAQQKAAEARNEQLVQQTIANYDELSKVELEAQQQSLEQSIDMQKDYIASKGRVNVMAAAMGTGGGAVASQLHALERTKYSNYHTILMDRQARLDNVKAQAESMRYQAASGMDVSPVSRPSWANAALNIGTAALSGYTQFKGQQTGADMLSKPKQLSSGG